MVAFSRNLIIRNVIALYGLQIANYLLPLLTLPYLGRTLGTLGFGQWATIGAIGTFGLMLSDYGFNISATRRVAVARARGEALGSLVLHVTVLRVALAAFAGLGMLVVALLFPYLPHSARLYTLLFLWVLTNSLTPLWLLQGLERLTWVSAVNVLGRGLGVVLIFAVVKRPQDVLLALAAQLVGQVLIALGTWWAARDVLASLPWELRTTELCRELKEGWPMFKMAAFSTVLTSSGVLILGLFVNAQTVGGYAAVERIGKALASLFVPVTQAIYPRVSARFAQSHAAGLSVLHSFARWVLPLSATAAVLAAYSSEVLVRVLLGPTFAGFALALVVMSAWMFLGVFNNFLGLQYLTNVGAANAYAKAFAWSAVVALLLYVALTPAVSFLSVPLGLLCGELLLASLLWRAAMASVERLA